jgi:hypothetical protein
VRHPGGDQRGARRRQLNADSPDILREAIKRVYAELLAKIGEQAHGASPTVTGKPPALAAAEPACDPVAEP